MPAQAGGSAGAGVSGRARAGGRNDPALSNRIRAGFGTIKLGQRTLAIILHELRADPSALQALADLAGDARPAKVCEDQLSSVCQHSNEIFWDGRRKSRRMYRNSVSLIAAFVVNDAVRLHSQLCVI
jgi:hypothetical protein